MFSELPLELEEIRIKERRHNAEAQSYSFHNLDYSFNSGYVWIQTERLAKGVAFAFSLWRPKNQGVPENPELSFRGSSEHHLHAHTCRAGQSPPLPLRSRGGSRCGGPHTVSPRATRAPEGATRPQAWQKRTPPSRLSLPGPRSGGGSVAQLDTSTTWMRIIINSGEHVHIRAVRPPDAGSETSSPTRPASPRGQGAAVRTCPPRR